MKKTLLFLLLYCICFSATAQITAYPAANDSRAFGAQCVDLYYTNPVVIGHQIDVSVSYYATNTDAQNSTNVLERFYEPLSNPQTIYARVDDNTSNAFAVSQVSISWSTSGPPPGISPCNFSV